MKRLILISLLTFFGCEVDKLDAIVEKADAIVESTDRIIETSDTIVEKQMGEDILYFHYKNPDDEHPYKGFLYFPNGKIEGESYFEEGELIKAYAYFPSGQLSVSREIKNGIMIQKEFYKDEYISPQRRELMNKPNTTELIHFDYNKDRIKRIREYKDGMLIKETNYTKSGDIWY